MQNLWRGDGKRIKCTNTSTFYKFCGRKKLIELCWGWENSLCFSSGIKERISRDQFIKAWELVSHNFYQLNLWATQRIFLHSKHKLQLQGQTVCVCVCTLNWNSSVKNDNGVTNSDLHEWLLFQITYNVTGNFSLIITSVAQKLQVSAITFCAIFAPWFFKAQKVNQNLLILNSSQIKCLNIVVL